jgi:hydroxymethylpyrimidine pyrophosphatase-like HAD family hydrolase
VKPRVLALDFDGTIAVNDTMDGDVAAAIQEARAAGLLVVLVTARTLSDLDALLSRPSPFDAIVAENGSVLRLPKLPSPIMLSEGPDLRSIAELNRREVPHHRGECVVDADADVAPQVVEIIRSLGLPLAITFNVNRLMVLPHGVSKASGLQEALWRLRTSAHNAIAVGHAENDHGLLDTCEIGAVAWGSDALRRGADAQLLDRELGGYLLVSCSHGRAVRRACALEPFATCSRRCRRCRTMSCEAISLAGTSGAGSRTSSETVSSAERFRISSGGTFRPCETPSNAPSPTGMARARHEIRPKGHRLTL